MVPLSDTADAAWLLLMQMFQLLGTLIWPCCYRVYRLESIRHFMWVIYHSQTRCSQLL